MESTETPRAGSKMGVILPVTPEFLERVDQPEAHLSRTAAQRFIDMCSPHGLTPVDIKQAWKRDATEMRLMGLGDHVAGLPDDVISFGFSAYAAAVGNGIDPQA